MDRGRHRALLIALVALGGGAVCALDAGRAGAEPTPPPPSVQATPAPSPEAAPSARPSGAEVPANPQDRAKPGGIPAAPLRRASPEEGTPTQPRATVHLDKDGKITLNRDPTVLSLDDLTQRLQTLRQKRGEKFGVIVRSAKDTPYAAVRSLLEKMRPLGLNDVAFAASEPSDGEKAPAASLAPQAASPSAVPPETLPGGGTRVGRAKAAMMDARQREEAEAKAAGDGSAAARLARMTPEEREAFRRNLQVWRQMPPEERQDLRKQANERNREEVKQALRDSGLQLDNDQQEVFALRYLQERRKLERQIQAEANAQRARRVPEILERLKREFEADKAATPAAGTASPPPKPPGN